MHTEIAPSWISKYVGLKFGDKGRGPDEFDCWGLVRWIYLQEHGIRLPDYLSGYERVNDEAGVVSSIRTGLEDGWTKKDRPSPFDLVIFNIYGKPIHVGMAADDDYFLHSPEGDFSRRERLSDRMWRNRVEGFYRHAALPCGGETAPSQDRDRTGVLSRG